MKILIVEDNPDLANNMSTYLSNEGYICSLAYDYRNAVDKIISFQYDLVVIDIMLPDGSGLDLLRELKHQQSPSGVIIVSARGALNDRLNGLDLGADDYLIKPFHLSELNSRLKAIYRRRKQDGNTLLTFDMIELNTETFEAMVNNTLLDLTRKEYELLLYFVVNANRLLTKQSIAEHLWGDHAEHLDNFDFVYQHIKNIRKKILNAGGKDYLKTIYGLGYKFIIP